MCFPLRVRQKQNKYPILFLTQGISEKYPELMDVRCQTTQIAISFAQSENILVSWKSKIVSHELLCLTLLSDCNQLTAEYNLRNTNSSAIVVMS